MKPVLGAGVFFGGFWGGVWQSIRKYSELEYSKFSVYYGSPSTILLAECHNKLLCIVNWIKQALEYVSSLFTIYKLCGFEQVTYLSLLARLQVAF